jgi:nucleoside phosphorylase
MSALAFAPVPARACAERLLVLSAFPGEIDHLLAAATDVQTDVVDGRSFFVGRLKDNDVVLALTGIGLVNATTTTASALDHYDCGDDPGITGIVFSGVSGGKTFIGDVTIPARWTLDDGDTWMATDPAMFAVAQGVSATLSQVAPLGDAACVGVDPDLVQAIPMPHPPVIIAGGDGASADGFGGRAFPCFPAGGDVFGCEPCRAPTHQIPDIERFANDALPFVDPAFFVEYPQQPMPAEGAYDAVDMETAAAAKVAADAGVPFIAFRALSDGLGDPLSLPGFPFQFFVYRQLAANNAAAVALAFLDAWSA